MNDNNFFGDKITARQINDQWADELGSDLPPENHFDNWKQLGKRLQKEFNSFTNFFFPKKYFGYFILLPEILGLICAIFYQVHHWWPSLNILPVVDQIYNRYIWIRLAVAVAFFSYCCYQRKIEQIKISGIGFYFLLPLVFILQQIYVDHLLLRFLGQQYLQEIRFWLEIIRPVIFITLFCLVVPDVRRSFYLLFFSYYQWQSYYLKSKVKPPFSPPKIFKRGEKKIITTDFSFFSLATRVWIWSPIAIFSVRKNQLTLIIFIIGGTTVLTANYLGGELISYFFDGKNFNQQKIENIKNNLPWSKKVAFTILLTILTPIFEELIFRKSIMDLGNKEKWSIFGSALVFGLGHSPESGILILLPYFLAGGIFGIIYYLSGNVWLAALAHIFNNTVAAIF